MKKQIPQGLIIGAIVLVVLIVVGIAWKSLSESTPPREKLPADAVKPDALPAGMDPNNARPAPPARGRGPVN